LHTRLRRRSFFILFSLALSMPRRSIPRIEAFSDYLRALPALRRICSPA
jgi:hypothetical protein